MYNRQERFKPKSYLPERPIVNYMNEKLRFEKSESRIDLRGEALQENRTYSNLKKRKVEVLDRIFTSMANLTFFVECIAEEEELRRDFEDDFKDLLGIRRSDPANQVYGFVFYHLVTGILRAGKETRTVRGQANVVDFSLIQNHQLQQIVRDKTKMALPRDLKSGGTLSAISNNFEMVIGWTGLLANRIDRENEKPDRTIDFKTTKLLAVDSLKSLIILRGPAGSGKTTICNAMVEVLGAYHSNILDLDITGSQEYKFERNLRNCLSSEYVIGMMFYGNSHTTEPSKWIEKFQERGYKILSIILYTSKETCFNRCREDNSTGRHPINKDKDRIYKYYDEFYAREKVNPFAEAAGIIETTVNTENKSPERIAHEILEKFNEIFKH